MMVAQLCEDTKYNWNVHFEFLNFVVCELYLTKTVKKNYEWSEILDYILSVR